MIEERLKNTIEKELLELPVMQYAWLETEDLAFSKRARAICRLECPRYAKSWSCPPGVGTVEECRRECAGYDGALAFTTIAEVQDAENMQEALATRREHEAVTRRIQAIFRKYFEKTLPLSAESCEYCERCAYPDAPCRHPEQRISCVEGYGIVVPTVAEKAGISFENGYNTVTWFSLVMFTNLSHDCHSFDK